jgi:hypothetical protein
MTFVMLNPSTADAEKDDPTIRRCVGFARREGCGEIVVVNLFAYRTSSPKVLAEAIGAGVDPWGPDQASVMSAALHQWAGPIVAAWGANPLSGMALEKLPPVPMSCLGVTKDGAPRHPLYVRGDAPLMEWPPTHPTTEAN